jgi:quinol-cytochrome oxidoreductase complex cytochrome b subunit
MMIIIIIMDNLHLNNIRKNKSTKTRGEKKKYMKIVTCGEYKKMKHFAVLSCLLLLLFCVKIFSEMV